MLPDLTLKKISASNRRIIAPTREKKISRALVFLCIPNPGKTKPSEITAKELKA
jgi:hypothetical protein